MEIKINLLPPYRKEEILRRKRLRTLLKFELAATGVIILFFAFLLSINYILDIQFKLISLDLILGKDNTRYTRVKELEEKFTEANAKIVEVTSIQKDQLYWSNLLFHLNRITPDQIEIDNLATKNLNIYLVGKAANRDYLIKFKDALASDGCFSDINLPLSNLVEKDNIDFQMDLIIKEDCIKNK